MRGDPNGQKDSAVNLILLKCEARIQKDAGFSSQQEAS